MLSQISSNYSLCKGGVQLELETKTDLFIVYSSLKKISFIDYCIEKNIIKKIKFKFYLGDFFFKKIAFNIEVMRKIGKDTSQKQVKLQMIVH